MPGALRLQALIDFVLSWSIVLCVKARGLKDPAGAKRRMEEKARAAKDLEAGGTAGAGGGGMKVGD
jgi:hypothetical protein